MDFRTIVIKTLMDEDVQSLKETSKRELIKTHTTKAKELKKAHDDALAAYHSAARALKDHEKTHPNYETRKAKKDAKDNMTPYEEPGRSRQRFTPYD